MAGGALGRIETELPHLPEALRKVGELILADPAAAVRSTIVALAERSGTSAATVTRFCRVFGFAGYSELRVALATENGRAAQAGWGVGVIGQAIGPGDPLDAVVRMMAAADARLIQETAAQLDLGVVAKAADAIVAAGRVLMFGMSTSGEVAAMLSGRLRRIRVPCWSYSDPHQALADAALLGEGDVAIGISHQGRTREVLESMGEAAGRGATTIAITSFARSPLAELAELVLTTASRETTFRPAGLAAVHSQLFVLDAVYVAVAQRTYERSTEAFERTIKALDSHRVERN